MANSKLAHKAHSKGGGSKCSGRPGDGSVGHGQKVIGGGGKKHGRKAKKAGV